jgi:1-deoxy-D-xylulose-5-phosphate reductoisomerase
MPAVLNAANEVAVAAFLAGQCSFPDITATIAQAMDRWTSRNRSLSNLEQAFAVDRAARRLAAELLGKCGSHYCGSE